MSALHKLAASRTIPPTQQHGREAATSVLIASMSVFFSKNFGLSSNPIMFFFSSPWWSLKNRGFDLNESSSKHVKRAKQNG
jgi:hypothetical protein